jgi:predicted DNA-binding WGR domain protein
LIVIQFKRRKFANGVLRMRKMLKHTSDGYEYWQVWQDEAVLVVHWGTIGERGQMRRLPIDGDAKKMMMSLTKEQRTKGFKPLNEDKLHDFVIIYNIDGFGTIDDLNKRHRIEELMDECLGWTGNGHCDGGDIGGDTMTICCLVVDPVIASDTIKSELEKHNLLENLVYCGLEELSPDYL